MMNAEECNRHADECASNAAIAPSESIGLEFLKLAAQWRAMAVREIFLGHAENPGAQILGLAAPARPIT